MHYFSQQDLFDRGELYYHSFFDHPNKKVQATADTYLMIDENAMQKIAAYNPNMKFIVLLRDPVDRAFSSYVYAKNFGYQDPNLSFLESASKEPELLKNEHNIIQLNNLAHFHQGMYHELLTKWTSIFPKEQFFICQSSRFWNHPTEVMNDFADFAGIQAFDDLPDIQLNKSSKAKFKYLEQFLLNRESPGRAFLRNVIPKSLKQTIFRSNLIDKIHNINRTETTKDKLTEHEKSEAKQIFSEDLKKLETDFGIGL